MNPAMIVFHPGLDGDIKETFRQVAALRREYPKLHRIMLLENKPRLGLGDEHCLGSSPEEMRTLLAETGCGFCLDVRHAFAYAAWAGRKWWVVIEEFVRLEPCLWHAADGIADSKTDSHDHIGDGTMPWESLALFWNNESFVTLECVKETMVMLKDFQGDLDLLRRRTEKS